MTTGFTASLPVKTSALQLLADTWFSFQPVKLMLEAMESFFGVAFAE